MNLGVQIVAFREKRLIVPVVEQFRGKAKVVVAVSSRPWHGYLDRDETFSRIYTKANIASMQDWRTEVEQRNWCMDQLQDCDYVLVCHADTFFTQKDIDKIVDFIQTATERQYDIPSVMYWKDLDTVVVPDPMIPAMLIRRDVRFKHSIIIEDQIVDAPQVPVLCHHLSWAKTDEEVKEKISSYEHAQEIVPNWYEDVWLSDKTENLSPTNPTDYKSLRKHPLPDEIRRLISKY